MAETIRKNAFVNLRAFTMAALSLIRIDPPKLVFTGAAVARMCAWVTVLV